VAGEPGIGKTPLLEYAAHAAQAGMETLGARGAEFEAEAPGRRRRRAPFNIVLEAKP
jgi:hypothetical protein